MLSLVISSSSNAVKYSSYFRSLGVDQKMSVAFLILDHSRNHVFESFIEQRVFCDGEMFYTHAADNKISAHQKSFQKCSKYIETLKNYFLADSKIESKPDKSSFSVLETNSSIEFFEKSDVIDLKYDKHSKSIKLEIKNKGLIQFDHLFVEKTDSCLSFLESKDSKLVENIDQSDLVWVCYKFKLSQEFIKNDFWFFENRDYDSIFDNCFYLQPQPESQLYVWGLIPDHQLLNQQFHIDFQNRLKSKIENKFRFMSLSFVEVLENTTHLMNSQKIKLKENNRISGFPSFSLYSNQNVYSWFAEYAKVFNKKHKIKMNNSKEGAL